MQKPKSFALILGVLIMSFLVGYLVFAQVWQEPTAPPPGENVPAPLNVGSTAQTKSGSLSFPIFYDSDNNAYYVNPAGTTVLAGNVGIGTTSPGGKLSVVYASGQRGIESTGPSGNTHIPWTDGSVYISGANIIFRDSSNVERVRITGGGNVGIGTASPGYKLDVAGQIRATGGTAIYSCPMLATDCSAGTCKGQLSLSSTCEYDGTQALGVCYGIKTAACSLVGRLVAP